MMNKCPRCHKILDLWGLPLTDDSFMVYCKCGAENIIFAPGYRERNMQKSTMLCSKCGTQMWQEPIVLTSYPEQYRYICPKCEYTQTSFTSGLGPHILSYQQWQKVQEDAKKDMEVMDKEHIDKLLDAASLLPRTKVQRHKELCDYLNDLYARKNADYGDSFHISYEQEGMAMPRIRLGDKYNRFCALTRGANPQQVNDESLRDTLIDLANYALMTVLELDAEAGQT